MNSAAAAKATDQEKAAAASDSFFGNGPLASIYFSGVFAFFLGIVSSLPQQLKPFPTNISIPYIHPPHASQVWRTKTVRWGIWKSSHYITMISKIPAEPKATEKSLRLSSLSGIFYPKNESELKELLSALFASTVTSVSSPYGILVPHAGFEYSGQTAACGYAKISPEFAGTFVLIGPSHAGVETSTSDMVWETPIGNVLPDLAFIEALSSSIPVDNDLISVKENSLEVQMPFIQYRFPKARIVPILMGDQSPRGAERVAQAVISATKTTGIRPIIIASGDGSHYVPAKVAEQNDLTVLAAVRTLDTSAFYEALSRLRPSMCGFGCIAAMAEICASFGAKEARVLLYRTSGDVTGDQTEVVGYAAMEVV